MSENIVLTVAGHSLPTVGRGCFACVRLCLVPFPDTAVQYRKCDYVHEVGVGGPTVVHPRFQVLD